MGLFNEITDELIASELAEEVIFRDPTGVESDTPIRVLFDERDVPENASMGMPHGFYSTVEVRAADLPVGNPLRRSKPFQIIAGGVTYNIIDSQSDTDSGSYTLKLKKA